MIPQGNTTRGPGWRRWLGAAGLLVLAPKCVVCVAGYLGAATALGLGGAEICGAPVEPAGHGAWVGWMLAVGAAGFWCWRMEPSTRLRSWLHPYLNRARGTLTAAPRWPSAATRSR